MLISVSRFKSLMLHSIEFTLQCIHSIDRFTAHHTKCRHWHIPLSLRLITERCFIQISSALSGVKLFIEMKRGGKKAVVATTRISENCILMSAQCLRNPLAVFCFLTHFVCRSEIGYIAKLLFQRRTDGVG